MGDTELGVLLDDHLTAASGADEVAAPMFTVTNPPGTVTVTTYLDGRVHRVDLSHKAVSMAETVLGEEIVVIAGLATQDARSAQYTVMLEGMREQGNDTAATRDFLSRELESAHPGTGQGRSCRAVRDPVCR